MLVQEIKLPYNDQAAIEFFALTLLLNFGCVTSRITDHSVQFEGKFTDKIPQQYIDSLSSQGIEFISA